LQLEGYEYDLSADLLTARVVQESRLGSEDERANVDVPISSRLRSLLDATMSELQGALEAGGDHKQATE
jgi:hypothetical protein